jgi:hypothetical protein
MAEHQQAQKSTESKPNIQTQTTLLNQILFSHPAAIIQRAKINPKSLTHADVMQLQRTIGNRAVGQLLSEIGLISSKAKQTQPVQMQTIPEEGKEPLQGKALETTQRQEIPEEEEPLQGKIVKPIQRQEIPEPEEESLHGKVISTIQRQEIPEEEEPLQGKFESIQRQEIPEEEPLQIKKENKTGMPNNLKAGVENLSGIDISNVRVHYNSLKPAEVGALAYTQGTNIHIAPGQERHLPHEAWHVVQQAQGRVRPTLQLKDIAVNDDTELEREADVMARKASKNFAFSPIPDHKATKINGSHETVLQNMGAKGVIQLCGTKQTPQKPKKPKKPKKPVASTKAKPAKAAYEEEERQKIRYKHISPTFGKKKGLRPPPMIAAHYERDMEIIDSVKHTTFVHISRSTKSGEESFGKPKESWPKGVKRNEITDMIEKINEGGRFDRKLFTKENNAHITLEGRYMRAMEILGPAVTEPEAATATTAPEEPEEPEAATATTAPEEPEEPEAATATTAPEEPEEPEAAAATTAPEEPEEPEAAAATTAPEEPEEPEAVAAAAATTAPERVAIMELKNGEPKDKEYDNLNYKDITADNNSPKVSDRSIQEWIHRGAGRARGNIDSLNPSNKEYLKDLVNEIEDSTSRFTEHLITSTPYLDGINKEGKLVHKNGNSWPGI